MDGGTGAGGLTKRQTPLRAKRERRLLSRMITHVLKGQGTQKKNKKIPHVSDRYGLTAK